LWGILATGAVAEVLDWCWKFDDFTWQVILSWSILAAAAFLAALWWLFISGFSWKRRLAVFGSATLVLVGYVGTFRFLGFSGDLVPCFEFRWRPLAEAKAAEYRYVNSTNLPRIGGTRDSVADASEPVADLPVNSDDWPQFEGPGRDGIAHGVHMRTDWEHEPPREVWRHPVGAGWSSFALVGKYAFTQEQRGTYEGVVCYDARTGKEIWAYLEPGQRFSNSLAGVGPRATPTVTGSRVYALGANGVFNSINVHDGRVVWQHSVAIEAGVQHLTFGMSGSPLVYDNLVVINAGGPRSKMKGTETSGRALVAYDRVTGKEIWASGNYQAGYASPVLATIAGVRQVVLFDGVGVGGYDATTGNELWRSPEWTNECDINIAQPIILPRDEIFLSSGYGTGCILLQVKKAGSTWSVTTRWTAPNTFKLKFNSGVCRDGFVYGLDEGILACLDLSNGKERWKSGRYGYGQVLLLDNALLVVSEEGDLVVVDVSPNRHHELARFHALEGKTWNHPAIRGTRLFVRNGAEAACFDFGPLQTAAVAGLASVSR
jgi:outer membrane protein assembly factor BamB